MNDKGAFADPAHHVEESEMRSTASLMMLAVKCVNQTEAKLVYHNSSKTTQCANILEYELGIMVHHMKKNQA